MNFHANIQMICFIFVEFDISLCAREHCMQKKIPLYQTALCILMYLDIVSSFYQNICIHFWRFWLLSMHQITIEQLDGLCSLHKRILVNHKFNSSLCKVNTILWRDIIGDDPHISSGFLNCPTYAMLSMRGYIDNIQIWIFFQRPQRELICIIIPIEAKAQYQAQFLTIPLQN